MSLRGKQDRFYVNLGGSVADVGAVRFGFLAPKKTYDNIASALGVVKLNDGEQGGCIFGGNYPRPARVRIRYLDAQLGGENDGEANDIKRTAIRFCEPDKVGDVTTGNALLGKKIFINGADKEYSILSCTLIG